MKRRKYTLPIFGYRYEICIADNVEEARKIYPEWADDCWGHVTTDDRGHGQLIVLTDSSYATIAHECEHLKSGILSYYGVMPCYGNDEVDAYLLAYLFQNVKDLKEGK